MMNPAKRVYLAVESWLNLSFSPALNPFYHLGTLTFFFFWIVLVSGLYLFIFFDTSLSGAYASVERLTHEQWYIGGVMRSLHRYASDAAVITIVLHLLREFSLDKYRGFRWFSWVTGVPLIWFVLLLGITGYWLVWDELGLYVATISAQLADALPFISGSMARNFVGSQLSDRFFTLMAFLHLLGLPLFLIFMAWVHVKRLSNVNITAPRGLSIGAFLALIVLSLIAPAYSHPPADIDTMPAVLHLDWFYLGAFPLTDHYSSGTLWIYALGITFLLILLPWIPPKASKPAAVVNLDHCNGCEQCAEDCPFDAISVQDRTDGARFEHEVVVNPSQCASCGICVGSCPSSNPFRQKKETLETGIDMPQASIDSIRNSLNQALVKLSGNGNIIVMGCENAFDTTELETDKIKSIQFICMGMMPPTMVEYALANGADGVFIGGCREGDCYYRHGNKWLDLRFSGERQPILRSRADRSRIRIYRAAQPDGKQLKQALKQFESEIAESVGGNNE